LSGGSLLLFVVIGGSDLDCLSDEAFRGVFQVDGVHEVNLMVGEVLKSSLSKGLGGVLSDRESVEWRQHKAFELAVPLEQFFQLCLLGCVGQVLYEKDVVVALALHSGRFVQHVEVDDVLILQPLLGLVDDDGLALCHLDSHTATGFFVEELSLGLIELLCHGSSHCVLVHEQVVPIGLVVKVGL